MEAESKPEVPVESKVEARVEPIAAKQVAAPRGQSTIEFPYLDQSNAAEIAVAVHEVGGSGCEWDQLAAHLKQAAQGGGFRMRMISAKQFGLVTYDRGKIALTSLGLRIVDPQQSRAAKVESFLYVALYKALYDKFRGATLPPNPGLEREMAALGVAPKQADKARQAFQRSAKYAGFFEFGSDRLVPPANGGPSPSLPIQAPAAPEPRSLGGGGGGGGDDLHPFVRGLLQKLPIPETEWTVEGRAKWLTAAVNIFDLMYLEPPDAATKIISIEVKSL